MNNTNNILYYKCYTYYFSNNILSYIKYQFAFIDTTLFKVL